MKEISQSRNQQYVSSQYNLLANADITTFISRISHSIRKRIVDDLGRPQVLHGGGEEHWGDFPLFLLLENLKLGVYLLQSILDMLLKVFNVKN